MSLTRNYKCKDVDMLITCKTIAGSFKSNISVLSAIRNGWNELYTTDLESRINTIMERYLGMDAKKGLREASANLNAIQVPARRDVSFFKTQVDDDFKKDKEKRDQILATLGFSKHLKKTQTGNQESLIQLLYTFKTNITDALRVELTAKGMNTSLIDNIVAYANTLSAANTQQENFKSSSKEITKEACEAFNAIYDEIIGICKIASAYFHYEPLKKEQFTFSKVLNNLGAAKKVAANTETTTTPVASS